MPCCPGPLPRRDFLQAGILTLGGLTLADVLARRAHAKEPSADTSVILIYLILGDSSGVFVKSVADNVMKFAGAVPTPSLVGFAVIVAIIYLVMQRLR